MTGKEKGKSCTGWKLVNLRKRVAMTCLLHARSFNQTWEIFGSWRLYWSKIYMIRMISIIGDLLQLGLIKLGKRVAACALNGCSGMIIPYNPCSVIQPDLRSLVAVKDYIGHVCRKKSIWSQLLVIWCAIVIIPSQINLNQWRKKCRLIQRKLRTANAHI